MIPRVLFINPWDRLIGPNRYLAEMLRSAPELATRSTVVFHEANDAIAEYRSMGCRVAIWPEIKLIHPHFTVSNVADLIQTHSLGLAKVIQKLRTFPPDVVVTNTEIVIVGGVAARILGIPHLQVFHSLLFSYNKERIAAIVKLYARWLSFLTNRFIAVSETVKQMVTEYGIESNKVLVVPNGFDVKDVLRKSERPLPADVQDLIDGRYPVFVSVGRISPMKGQDILVEAMNSLRISYPLSRCLIVGRVGSENSVEDVMGFNQYLIRRIEACKLKDYVRFIGEVDYVPALLAHSDIYIHPSWTESFSRVVAEALICGKPVVCTSAGALPEVVGSQGAVFVEPGNGEALAQGVVKVLREDSMRQDIVSFGRACIESHYPVYRATEKLLDVLKAVVGNNNGYQGD
jgi:glycosyltransferase involved in cell wall biosynthesis